MILTRSSERMSPALATGPSSSLAYVDSARRRHSWRQTDRHNVPTFATSHSVGKTTRGVACIGAPCAHQLTLSWIMKPSSPISLLPLFHPCDGDKRDRHR